MNLDENFKKTVERMQSNVAIDIATIFYGAKERGITSQEVGRLTGIRPGTVSSRRLHLERHFGWKFKVVDKYYYLVDITLIQCKRHAENIKRLNERKKEERKKIKPVDVGCAHASLLNGVFQ